MEHTIISTLSSGELQEREGILTSRLGGTSQMAWEELPRLKLDPTTIARNRIVTADRSHTAHVAFDMMRTKLLQSLRQNNWTSVAITSPTPGCGKTFTAVNLAFSLANQQDCRTVLLDLDMKRPQIGKTLGIKNAGSMERFLRGEAEVNDLFMRHGDNLAIAPNSHPAQFSAELLQSAVSATALQVMRQKTNPDIILFDLPPMLSTDDVLAFLPNVDCVILVAAAEHTTLSEVDVCEQSLAEKSNVLGVVLNKCQFSAEKYGY